MKHPGLINSVIKDDKDFFQWSEKSFAKAQIIIKRYPPRRQQSAVIPVLDLAQRQNKGFLTKNIIERVAETLNMSFIRVMEIASFYSMFNLEPVGLNYVQICRTTPCWLRGSNKLLETAKKVTNCDLGQTSKDKKFTLVEVECLGACCNAPMVQINDYYYEDLTEENFKALLLKIKNNENVNKGSQTGRQSSEPQKN